MWTRTGLPGNSVFVKLQRRKGKTRTCFCSKLNLQVVRSRMLFHNAQHRVWQDKHHEHRSSIYVILSYKIRALKSTALQFRWPFSYTRGGGYLTFLNIAVGSFAGSWIKHTIRICWEFIKAVWQVQHLTVRSPTLKWYDGKNITVWIFETGVNSCAWYLEDK